MSSDFSSPTRPAMFFCPACGEVELPDEVGTHKCPECGTTVVVVPTGCRCPSEDHLNPSCPIHGGIPCHCDRDLRRCECSVALGYPGSGVEP